MFNDHRFANLALSLTVKEFRKSAVISWNYWQEYSGTHFLTHGVVGSAKISNKSLRIVYTKILSRSKHSKQMTTCYVWTQTVCNWQDTRTTRDTHIHHNTPCVWGM